MVMVVSGPERPGKLRWINGGKDSRRGRGNEALSELKIGIRIGNNGMACFDESYKCMIGVVRYSSIV